MVLSRHSFLLLCVYFLLVNLDILPFDRLLQLYEYRPLTLFINGHTPMLIRWSCLGIHFCYCVSIFSKSTWTFSPLIDYYSSICDHKHYKCPHTNVSTTITINVQINIPLRSCFSLIQLLTVSASTDWIIDVIHPL